MSIIINIVRRSLGTKIRIIARETISDFVSQFLKITKIRGALEFFGQPSYKK